MSLFKRLFGRKSQGEKVAEPLDGTRGNTILEFQQLIQSTIELSELQDVEFGMWLPCEEDRTFSNSPVIEKWSAIYSLTKNYWSYITADLLKSFKLIDTDPFRMGLPEEFQAFGLLTKDGEQIVFSLSQGKGIRFHFADTTPLVYRLKFLDSFIDYAKAWKEIIELNGGSADQNLDFADWWVHTVEVSKTVEKKEPLKGVGKIAK